MGPAYGCAVGGGDGGGDEVRRLTRAPSGPHPVAVGALLKAVAPGARRDEGRALLERLESFRAFHRAP